MTSDEHKAAAEKLTNAVKNNTNGAYDEWVQNGQALENHETQADFVQRHAGLAAKPSTADLKAISAHVNSSLQSNVAEIKAKNPGEHVVGGFCLAED